MLLSFDSLSNRKRQNLLSCRPWLWNNDVFGHPIVPFQVLKNGYKMGSGNIMAELTVGIFIVIFIPVKAF